MIKCPECGKEISDKAQTCVNCGCPIANQFDGKVKIKMPQGDPSLWLQSKYCSIVDEKTGKLLWEGRMGQTAEIILEQPTALIIQCGKNLTNPLKCVVNPFEWVKYAITQDMGIHWRATYNISKVDIIDSDR